MALEAAARSMFDQSVFIDQAGEQPAAIGDLTPSELDVLKLLADGHQTKGIARLRGTSDRTVEKQIASAKEKLGGGSTIATVARAVRFNTI